MAREKIIEMLNSYGIHHEIINGHIYALDIYEIPGEYCDCIRTNVTNYDAVTLAHFFAPARS